MRYVVEVSRKGDSWQCWGNFYDYVSAEKAYLRAKNTAADYLKSLGETGAGPYRHFRIREISEKTLVSSRMEVSFMDVSG